jgi:hypothetical protein
MLKEEFRRAFFSWSFLLAIAITVASFVIGVKSYGGPVYPYPDNSNPFSRNAFDAFLYGMGLGGLLPFFAPLIAVLPFTVSFITDRSSGYITFILSRTSFRKYITSKFLANLLAGGISIALPLLLGYGVINIFYLRGLTPLPVSASEGWINPSLAWAEGRGPFGYLYRTKPDLYIFSLIGIAFLWGATYATLGMALSLFIRNKYSMLATPFVLYEIAHFVTSVLWMAKWSPLHNFAPFMLKSTSYITTFGEIGIIFIISTICIFMFAKKKRVYE